MLISEAAVVVGFSFGMSDGDVREQARAWIGAVGVVLIYTDSVRLQPAMGILDFCRLAASPVIRYG
jgi:hypothetical protein